MEICIILHELFRRFYLNPVIVNTISFLRLCLISMTVVFSSCATTQQGTEEQEIKGTIIVVGNHPFESLAVEQENGTIIRLDAGEEIERQLFACQGKRVSLICSGVVRSEGFLKSFVKKFKLLSQ